MSQRCVCHWCRHVGVWWNKLKKCIKESAVVIFTGGVLIRVTHQASVLLMWQHFLKLFPQGTSFLRRCLWKSWGRVTCHVSYWCQRGPALCLVTAGKQECPQKGLKKLVLLYPTSLGSHTKYTSGMIKKWWEGHFSGLFVLQCLSFCIITSCCLFFFPMWTESFPETSIVPLLKLWTQLYGCDCSIYGNAPLTTMFSCSHRCSSVAKWRLTVHPHCEQCVSIGTFPLLFEMTKLPREKDEWF